jgi:hypothetical protein
MTTPTRIQRRRSKGWRAPEGAVYVGRGCGLPWGNPFRAKDAEAAGYANGAAVATLAFQRWLAGDREFKRAEVDPEGDWILANIGMLRGKVLMCWCPEGRPCHADVLLAMANRPRCEP